MSRIVPRGVLDAARVLAVASPSPHARHAEARAALVASELQLPLRTLRANGDVVADCVAQARGALLVMAKPQGNALADWLIGTPAERLVRMAQGPVLVVKQPPQEAYQRVLVAVDLLPWSDHLAAEGAALARGPALTLFHAVSPSEELLMRELDATADALRAHRRDRANAATTRMAHLVADRARWTPPVVAFGGPAESILAAETGHRAELIVVGKRPRGAFADFLLGSVTRQVLARSEADVLVVPLGPRDS